jgi:SAM-dependent methyltransferase
MTDWPKPTVCLTPEQTAIRDDFMEYFLRHVYGARFGAIQRFSHTYPLRSAREGLRTLDVGAGLGEHLAFEERRDPDYVALELRPEMAAELGRRYPDITTVAGDIQAGLQFDANEFDRVLAIHVLEHLPNLPAALEEVRRLLRPDGTFAVVLPCEGGAAYSLGRRVTTERIFRKRYNVSYDWYIKSEHVNRLDEIIPELESRFTRTHGAWFPLRLPMAHLNLCVGLTYRLG